MHVRFVFAGLLLGGTTAFAADKSKCNEHLDKITNNCTIYAGVSADFSMPEIASCIVDTMAQRGYRRDADYTLNTEVEDFGDISWSCKP